MWGIISDKVIQQFELKKQGKDKQAKNSIKSTAILDQIDLIFDKAFGHLSNEISSMSHSNNEPNSSKNQQQVNPSDINLTKTLDAKKKAELQYMMTPKELIYGLSSNVIERQFQTLSHSTSVIVNPNFHLGLLISPRIPRDTRCVFEFGHRINCQLYQDCHRERTTAECIRR